MNGAWCNDREKKWNFYLLGLHCNLRAETGLQGFFALHLTLFTLRVIFTDNRPVFTDGGLEVIIRKRWVAVFKGVLQCKKMENKILFG